MKILGWMQNTVNGSNGKKKSNSTPTTYYMLHEPCKQEFSDWPQALLVIGTLGNHNFKEDSDHSINTNTAQDSSQHDCEQESLDEAGNHDQNNEVIAEQREGTMDQINLNSQHSRFQIEEKENETTFSDGENSNGGSLYPNSSVIHCLDKSKSFNGRKSLVFLLKKMFGCRSGFPPKSPSFRDLLSTQTTMEKILRARLHKKLYPHGSSSAISRKKCLENKHNVAKANNCEEELTSDADNGSKWDKTDSEYIVLEI